MFGTLIDAIRALFCGIGIGFQSLFSAYDFADSIDGIRNGLFANWLGIPESIFSFFSSPVLFVAAAFIGVVVRRFVD